MRRTWVKLPKPSSLQRNILKCATAYFIGSLFTFIPALSRLVAYVGGYHPEGGERKPSPLAHMVATIVVYFNPAKTAGAMYEADFYCLLALAYATILSLGSMSAFWNIGILPDWRWLAHALVLTWIGVGMSIVSWLKVRIAKASFNPACSMTAIITFIVVVREGGWETLRQVAFTTFLGSAITNLVCFFIWPTSATADLRADFNKTLDSFAVVLELVTSDFMDENDGSSSGTHAKSGFTSAERRQFSRETLKKAVDDHQASFTGLKRSLDEARMEWLPSTADETHATRHDASTAYEDAVDCMNRLAQHLNGLRSCAGLQYEMAAIAGESKDRLDDDPTVTHVSSRNLARWLGTQQQHFRRSTSADRTDRHKKGKTSEHVSINLVQNESAHGRVYKTDNDVFEELVDELGPSLTTLSSQCTNVLHRLRDTFASSISNITSDVNHQVPEYEPIGLDEFVVLAEDIERSLMAFESSSNDAIMRFYSRSENQASLGVPSELDGPSGSDLDSDRSNGLGSSNTIATTPSDSEAVFLVYYFIFTLQEFARELIVLVEATSRIYTGEKVVASSGVRSRVWHVITRFGAFLKQTFGLPRLYFRQRGVNRPSSNRRPSTFASPQFPRNVSYFPKVEPHAPNTIQTPSRKDLTLWGKVKQSIWVLGVKLQDRTIRYAFKAGMALAALASLAFIEKTRPLFTRYRGEWALISFFVVISPTIGATNFLSLHRILGTILGAVTAVCSFTLLRDSPILLAIFGFFFSIPCFYYILTKPQYATSGRFVLLAYNLTCLHCYNLRDSDISVQSIAFRRSAAVTLGVVWAGVVSRLWWPAEARRELSNALSEFCLNIGWLYTRLVADNSGLPASNVVSDISALYPETQSYEADGAVELNEGSNQRPAETNSLLSQASTKKLNSSILMFMAMELHLQIKLIELNQLLAQAAHEPRLKGPFPTDLYREILQNLQTILDRLHSMRCVTTREEWFTGVRRDFILPVSKERREMVGNVILYFSVLSSAFKLKAPLPPYLPPAEKSRQRLVFAIRRLPLMQPSARSQLKGSRQLLYFAYALSMKGVTRELEVLGRTLQDVFGVIGQTREEFEGLFEVNTEE